MTFEIRLKWAVLGSIVSVIIVLLEKLHTERKGMACQGQNYVFTNVETKIAKGVAVTMMVAHHIWRFPDRLIDGGLISFLMIFDEDAAFFFGGFFKICTTIFMFLGGYGTYRQYANGKFNLFDKIKGLYIRYWKIFIIFVPIGFLVFSDQIQYCTQGGVYYVFDNFDAVELLKNFLALDATYNSEWYFLFNYFIAVISFPIFILLIKNHPFGVNIWFVICFSVIMSHIFPGIGNIEIFNGLNNNWLFKKLIWQSGNFSASFFMGCVFAKDNKLEELTIKLRDMKLLNPMADLAMIAVIAVCRSKILGAEMDIIYVPVFIVFVLDFIHNFKHAEQLFRKLGEHSTNIWLIHTFYCYYFYPAALLISKTKYALIGLAVLLAFSYASSVLIDKFYAWEFHKK